MFRTNATGTSVRSAASRWRGLLAAALCGLALGTTSAACTRSGTGESTSPPMAPTDDTPAPPVTTTVTGEITATNGGQPLGGLTASSSTATAVTDAAGRFTFVLSGTGLGIFPLSISGPGIITRTTRLDLSPHAVALGVFSSATGFDLAYYRQLARGVNDNSAGIARSIQRWTRDPMLYIRTIDDTGRALDPQALDLAETTSRDTIGLWTGGQLKFAAIVRGTETREGVPGWLTIQWGGAALENVCGFSGIGFEGNAIEIDTRTPGCRCAGLAIDPFVVRHELGHAFGLWHTSDRADVMYPSRSGSCSQQLSAKEREYAAYMYSRPVGSTDPDNDPLSSVFVAP